MRQRRLHGGDVLIAVDPAVAQLPAPVPQAPSGASRVLGPQPPRASIQAPAEKRQAL
jgi:hypothetical protein